MLHVVVGGTGCIVWRAEAGGGRKLVLSFGAAFFSSQASIILSRLLAAAAGYLSLSFASSYICYATYLSTHSASYHANTHINSRNVLGYIISE